MSKPHIAHTSNMPVFRSFPRLPPELRCQIWQSSLETWSVVTVSANKCSYTLQPIGWDKCVVGRVCIEARIIMEKTCKAFALGGTAWINLQSTTLFFGEAAKASHTIGRLDPRLCSDMTHAAIIWTTWPEVVGCIKQMSKRCHSLTSISIFDAGKPVTHHVRPLGPEDVERMVAFPLCSKPKYEPWWMDGDALTADLQAWFSRDPVSSLPAINMIPL
ncbi:hypothetical protein F5B22DRAFT_103838 [Xylaria bambusicola]|uniref:uncharacterized protein n=1 Tax=Xylaria bambusicola TaxID=326684 RepID=UPI0020075B7F|nr:uncharacterized protein F5B22DRAFT_103838 [Xylaria bambusicola]KAI0517888.1 hypothetical protein F5B22DRAFT_103838 [Xylaria bambusicola]